MTSTSYLPGGDHLTLRKDHFKGDHLHRQKPLKANKYGILGGHFNPVNDSDRGGHLSPPLFIEGVTSGTQPMTTFLTTDDIPNFQDGIGDAKA